MQEHLPFLVRLATDSALVVLLDASVIFNHLSLARLSSEQKGSLVEM